MCVWLCMCVSMCVYVLCVCVVVYVNSHAARKCSDLVRNPALFDCPLVLAFILFWPQMWRQDRNL